MQAPAIGGVRVPRGNGETVRLPRGASLTDFAERIDTEAGALVQVLFHLGEMVTATQSVDEDTFKLWAAMTDRAASTRLRSSQKARRVLPSLVWNSLAPPARRSAAMLSISARARVRPAASRTTPT